MKTILWQECNATERKDALARPVAQQDPVIAQRVDAIMQDVQKRGDEAVRDYTQRFDGFDPSPMLVPAAEIEAAAQVLDPTLRAALDQAYANIRAFHEQQGSKPYSLEIMQGVTCARRVVPFETVGLYVPGGSAPLFSTALMLGVPAQLAGVKNRILCTPGRDGGRVDPAILYVAKVCGLTSVFRVGGAQAVAAMAFGTQSLPRCDKIMGPGNVYVTEAKVQAARLAGGPAIDMPAGPSEVLVIVDDKTPPAFAAADLLAQAEHDTVAQVVLIAPNRAKIEAIQAEVEAQLAVLPRREIAAAAMGASVAIVAGSKDEAMAISNAYAPEHLILCFEGAESWLDAVQNAGSVFCGPLTPESFGDYASGTNHVLPTAGAARSYAGLSLEAFQKTITVQSVTTAGLCALGGAVMAMAQAEGLAAHANAVKVRLSAMGQD